MMNKPPPSTAIKAWAEEDRPREKMLIKGKQALTDSELLAILIGSGSVGQNVLELSKEILQKADNDLDKLGRRSLKELMGHRGIGEAKAITIAAALELGRRRQLTAIKDRPSIQSSKDAFNVIGPILMDLDHEEFWILVLSRSNEVKHTIKISSGGTVSTVVDVKLLIKTALLHGAQSLVLVHNHPSGNLAPSKSDLELTKTIKVAAEFMEIKVLDHLIVSNKGYYSFADHGNL